MQATAIHDDDIPLVDLIRMVTPPKQGGKSTSLRGVEKKKPTTLRRRTQGRVKNRAGKKIKKTPVNTPAACIVGDIVWATGVNNSEEFPFLFPDQEDVSETTFFIQHPDMAICRAIGEIVARAGEDSDLDAFPGEFKNVVDAIDKGSPWKIVSIDTSCGGLQLGNLKEEMDKVDNIVVAVSLDGDSTVIVPYDEARFGILYAAAQSSLVK
jgi:hypothetical protein